MSIYNSLMPYKCKRYKDTEIQRQWERETKTLLFFARMATQSRGAFTRARELWHAWQSAWLFLFLLPHPPPAFTPSSHATAVVYLSVVALAVTVPVSWHLKWLAIMIIWLCTVPASLAQLNPAQSSPGPAPTPCKFRTMELAKPGRGDQFSF